MAGEYGKGGYDHKYSGDFRKGDDDHKYGRRRLRQ